MRKEQTPMRGSILSAAILAMLMLAGCFPSTVSVAPDGRIALPREEGIIIFDFNGGKPLRIHEEGRNPSWVQWSPKGDRLLYVADNTLFTCSSDGRNHKSLYRVEGTCGYALWSPDGKRISVTAAGSIFSEAPHDDNEDQTGEQYPGLVIVDSSSGKVQASWPRISFIHRWLPDSRQVAVFHLLKKDKETGMYEGEIACADCETKELTPYAFARSMESWLDVPPEGKEVYFTALSAAIDKKDLRQAEKESQNKLFRLSPAKRTIEEIGSASIVIISPDGQRLLALRKQQDDIELIVMDREGEQEKRIARSISLNSNEMAGGKILPAWLNRDEVIYWKYVTVLSPDGKALYAYAAKADGTKTTFMQPMIEQAVQKAEKPGNLQAAGRKE